MQIAICDDNKDFLPDIVNMAHICRFQQPDILLKNGNTIPVSRARYGQAKAAYFEYVGQIF